MKESDLQRLIMIAASAEGHRLFRMNTGLAWVGEIVSKTPDLITLKNYRPFKAGIEGMSDLMGATNRGRFAVLEVKIGRRKPTLQQSRFVAMAVALGGVGAVVWSVEGALAALNSPAPWPGRSQGRSTSG